MTGRNSSLVWAVLAVAGVVGLGVGTWAAQQSLLAPGNQNVKGLGLEAHEATWQQRVPDGDGWIDRGTVTEQFEAITEGGVERWRRRQIVDAGAVTFVNDTIVDRATLRPVRFERRLDGEVPDAIMERLAEAGQVLPYTIEFDDQRFTRTSGSGADAKVETGSLPELAFEGSVLGLVVAALPLAEGYQATLPVTFIMPGDGSFTSYHVVATVEGRETHDIGPRRGASAWKVDIEWLDPGTGGVMSAGGADEAGGAYWIVDGAGGSIPHVLKYRNESVDFELLASGG